MTKNLANDSWTGTYYNPVPGWGVVGGFQAPNEPGSGRLFQGPGSIKEQCQLLQAATAARTNETVLGGGAYIRFDNGRIETTPAKAPQLPVVGPGNAFNVWAQQGDYTDGTSDTGSAHPYQGSHGINTREIWGTWGVNDAANYASMDSYNGAFSAGGQWTRTIPMFVTEFGYYTRPNLPTADVGLWRINPAAAGEYIIQSLVNHYAYGGIKRDFIYKLNSEGGEFGAAGQPPGMGLYSFSTLSSGASGWQLTAAGAIVKNFLSLFPFEQPTNPAPVNVVHSWSGPGATFHRTGDNWPVPDFLAKVTLATASDLRVVLVRRREIWDGFANAKITVADPLPVTLTLPPGYTRADRAIPGLNPIESATDGQTYPGGTNGTQWNPLTVTGGQVTVTMAGLTQVIRLRP